MNQPDHLTRRTYPGHISAIADAERVLNQLCAAIAADQSLVIPRESIEFLARRAQTLVHAAHLRANGAA